ncbi:helix-turn-helix transcriptional regulator [Methylobacterium sp. J-078]|uniref:helix-turn-helix transcriptional regulator n=1 Tax=Methylobacterium sp. J-078 TaxID=2836657 RepID=UPI001FB916A3|nr:helix-turn-helix transcriptional regulator [Methylobacterium sp. J-078]MCJ2046950.1 helix-turn-helix transcriptional regulator [Methylobacterium sp. J-078]
MNEPDPADLSAVIARIYDAAVDPKDWSGAIESVCLFVGGDQALMYWHDALKPDVDTLFRFNDDPHYTRLYEDRYAALNPLFPAFAFHPVGGVVSASDMVPDAEMQGTRFHREWLAPQGMTDSLGVVLERDATRGAFLTVQWQGKPMEPAARYRMALLAPHLLRSVAIGRLFVNGRRREAALTGALDHVEAGVLLVSETGRLLLANARGRRMIEEGRLLREVGGRVRATSTVADRAVFEHLRAIGERDGNPGDDHAIPLSDAADGHWTATVLPLSDERLGSTGVAQGAVAAIFVRSPSQAVVSPLESFARRHHLTASEIRVVEAMLRLTGVDAIADALGVAGSTVKTHLKHVFRKCGARTQAELIRMIAGLSA